MDDPLIKSKMLPVFHKIVLSPATYKSYNLNACLYGIALPTFGIKIMRMKMDTWNRSSINVMITRISNASQQATSDVVKALQTSAKDRNRWDGPEDDFNLIFSLNWLENNFVVLISMDGFFSTSASPDFDVALKNASQDMMMQLYPVEEERKEEIPPDDIVERQVDVLEVVDGHESYYHTVDPEEFASGAFSSLVDLRLNLDQEKQNVLVSQLIIETPRDDVVTSEIRSASYYVSDYAWNQYVRHRSPRRLYEILSIISQLPHGKIIAPCDGPGVVALACKMLNVDCLSSDSNVGVARVMFEKVIKEDWTRTLQKAKLGDIIFLSHCEEMCPGIVQSALTRGNIVIYYGKEPMFLAMEKMHQISLHLWSSHLLPINISPVQLASDHFFGKMLKYRDIGIISEIALRNVRMLSLFSADSSISYLGDKKKYDAFTSFLLLHGLVRRERPVQAVVAYSANEIIRAFAQKPQNAVVIDMRIGKTYREFPRFDHFRYWHTMKCHRRMIYEFLGKVTILKGKGISVDYCDTGTCYTWFDKLGNWKLLLEGKDIVHRISVEVLD